MSFNAPLPKLSVTNTQLEKWLDLFLYASAHALSVIENDRCACKWKRRIHVIHGIHIYIPYMRSEIKFSWSQFKFLCTGPLTVQSVRNKVTRNAATQFRGMELAVNERGNCNWRDSYRQRTVRSCAIISMESDTSGEPSFSVHPSAVSGESLCCVRSYESLISLSLLSCITHKP